MTEDLLYRENILDHCQHPHNAGPLPGATVTQREYNPLCGDEITLYLKLAKGRIEDVRFQGRGCAISQASASMLTDELRGMAISEVRAIPRQRVFDNLGIEVSPGRVNCALLILKAANKALDRHTGESNDDAHD